MCTQPRPQCVAALHIGPVDHPAGQPASPPPASFPRRPPGQSYKACKSPPRIPHCVWRRRAAKLHATRRTRCAHCLPPPLMSLPLGGTSLHCPRKFPPLLYQALEATFPTRKAADTRSATETQLTGMVFRPEEGTTEPESRCRVDWDVRCEKVAPLPASFSTAPRSHPAAHAQGRSSKQQGLPSPP